MGGDCPDDAIFLGYKEPNCKMYLGRAWIRYALLPAEIVLKNGTWTAYASYRSGPTEVQEYEFVRMDPGSYRWEKATRQNFPSNGIVAGTALEGIFRKTLFFGRALHEGIYVHGMVYGKEFIYSLDFIREINFSSFEILVRVEVESNKD